MTTDSLYEKLKAEVRARLAYFESHRREATHVRAAFTWSQWCPCGKRIAQQAASYRLMRELRILRAGRVQKREPDGR